MAVLAQGLDVASVFGAAFGQVDDVIPNRRDRRSSCLRAFTTQRFLSEQLLAQLGQAGAADTGFNVRLGRRLAPGQGGAAVLLTTPAFDQHRAARLKAGPELPQRTMALGNSSAI